MWFITKHYTAQRVGCNGCCLRWWCIGMLYQIGASVLVLSDALVYGVCCIVCVVV